MDIGALRPPSCVPQGYARTRRISSRKRVLLQPITMLWLARDTILFVGLRNISTAIQKTLILDTYLPVDFRHPHHPKLL